MPNTIVTGGAGYIGTRLVERLLYECHDVHVLDILKYGNEPLANFKDNPKFHLHVADIRDEMAVARALKNIDLVVHLAAISGFEQCKENPAEAREINVDATKTLLDLAVRANVKRLIYASTCSVYGNTDGNFVDEQSQITPISDYGTTKYAAEQEVIARNGHNLETVALRFATATGTSYRMRFDLLPAEFVKDAVENKATEIKYWSSYRPYMHVLDISRAISLALTADSEKVAGEIFNVADETQNFTKEDLIRMIHAYRPNWEIRYDSNKMTGDKRNYRTHGRKIKQILGFDRTTTIDGAIAEMIEYAQKTTG
jgi:nucleoside-diphosphate-sugar epimerase